MMIVVGKNGPVYLLSDGQPAELPPEYLDPEKREERYAAINRSLGEECGTERAPLTPKKA